MKGFILSNYILHLSIIFTQLKIIYYAYCKSD